MEDLGVGDGNKILGMEIVKDKIRAMCSYALVQRDTLRKFLKGSL